MATEQEKLLRVAFGYFEWHSQAWRVLEPIAYQAEFYANQLEFVDPRPYGMVKPLAATLGALSRFVAEQARRAAVMCDNASWRLARVHGSWLDDRIAGEEIIGALQATTSTPQPPSAPARPRAHAVPETRAGSWTYDGPSPEPRYRHHGEADVTVRPLPPLATEQP